MSLYYMCPICGDPMNVKTLKEIVKICTCSTCQITVKITQGV